LLSCAPSDQPPDQEDRRASRPRTGKQTTEVSVSRYQDPLISLRVLQDNLVPMGVVPTR
jgi:hypothetical protein